MGDGPDAEIVDVAIDYIVANGYIRAVKDITYSKAAVRSLRRMPANISRLIRQKIEAYAANPASQANNVKPLKGRNGIRLRVGGWRVIMRDEEILDIFEIGPRGSVYDD